MANKNEIMTADFLILKLLKKMKNNKFCKILLMQTSNLLIFLGIYISICCMPMQITLAEMWQSGIFFFLLTLILWKLQLTRTKKFCDGSLISSYTENDKQQV